MNILQNGLIMHGGGKCTVPNTTYNIGEKMGSKQLLSQRKLEETTEYYDYVQTQGPTIYL